MMETISLDSLVAFDFTFFLVERARKSPPDDDEDVFKSSRKKDNEDEMVVVGVGCVEDGDHIFGLPRCIWLHFFLVEMARKSSSDDNEDVFESSRKTIKTKWS